MKMRFCYKVNKSVGLAQDEDGNDADSFACCKISVKEYHMPAEQYKENVDSLRTLTAAQLDCDISMVEPITLNEYLDSTEEEE